MVERGNVFYNQENYKEAVMAYNKAIELNPNDYIAYNNKGNALDRMEEYEEAIVAYNKSIELNPTYPAAYYNKGAALSTMGEYKEAVILYNKTIELYPGDAVGHNIRGNALDSLGEYKEAVLAYNKAIQLNPGYAVPYYNKGSAQYHMGEHKEALIAYNEAIGLKPQDAVVHNLKGNVLDSMGQRKEAVVAYKRAIKLDPNLKTAYIFKEHAVRALEHEKLHNSYFKSREEFDIDEKPLGNSMSGCVYKSLHKPTKNYYAIEKVPKGLNETADSEETKYNEGLIREIQILSSTYNPYILKEYGHFIQDETDHIVMDLCEGGDLLNLTQEHAEKKILIKEDLIWRFFCQMCLGLSYLHSNNIIHSDLALHNLLLSRDKKDIKIGGLGLCKGIPSGGSKLVSSDQLSRKNTPPECLNNEEASRKSDVWALCCILFELASFEDPIRSSKLKVVLDRNVLINEQYSSKIRQIADLCLKVDPTERPAVSGLINHPFLSTKMREL